MATKVKKLSKRGFLEGTEYSDSWYSIQDSFGEIYLTLADCGRKIQWNFGSKGNKRGKRKIAKVKAFIDELYNYLHEE